MDVYHNPVNVQDVRARDSSNEYDSRLQYTDP
jgi:hypothetical protein